ncbi:MAG: acetylornithine deacetylase [Gammaproteobacteria bacterium]
MGSPAPTLLEMIARLVGTPSMSSVNPSFDTGNRAVIDLLAGWLAGLGFAVEVMPLPQWPDKANLIATLGTGPGGLVLAGHTDTVPYDEGRWNHDPFVLTEQDGRLYGLGTSDMKAFLAMAVEAARGLRPQQLSSPLVILATADEESSMDGAKELVRQGRPRARYAVIGEPSGMRPVRMHKGILMEAIRLYGRSGHSSDPSLGVSALEGMYRVIGELLAWRRELQQRHREPLFRVPVPTLNLGHIHGGDNPNRICGSCELHIDLRPLPGMALDELRAEMRQRLQACVKDSGLELNIEPLFQGTPAFELPATSELVRVAEKLTGHSAASVAFATEAPYLAQLDIETLVLGPGDIDQAHQPDEYLLLERVQPTVDLLQQLIRRFCVGD